MDRSLVEKSFTVRSERVERRRNVLSLLLFALLAALFRTRTLCFHSLKWCVRSDDSKILLCDTGFKISLILAAYNLVCLVFKSIFRTRLQATESDVLLLGLHPKDGSIEIVDKHQSFSKLDNSAERKLKIIPCSENSHNKSDQLHESGSKGLISFQDNWNLSGLNISDKNAVSHLNISPASTKRIANLADIIEKSFSFNFPFKPEPDSPKFVPAVSNSDLFYHTKNADRSQDPHQTMKYTPGYLTPKKNEVKSSIFDSLDYVDSFNLTTQQKMSSILKIRKWLSKSILENIVQEIETINRYLKKNGFYDHIVGKTSCSALTKFYSNAGHSKKYISNLPNLVVFLELTIHQEYLVNRIKELARDGSMAKYSHKAGSTSSNFKWNHSLPSDSEIVMHCFLTYMDIHYPDSLFNLNKSFSAKYYNKAEPSNMKEDEFSIYKETLSVHYYSLVIAGKHVKIDKTNDNIFLVILHLIVFAKYCLEGYIGSLYLGKTGINILSVVD